MTTVAFMVCSAWIQVIDSFILTEAAAGAPATTQRARRDHLMHLARRIEAEPVEVTGDMLLSYVASQTWANETRRGRRSTFRKFWSWGLSAGRLTIPAADSLPVVKAGAPSPRPCPDGAYQRALMAARPRERLMLRLSAELGLRRAEVSQIHARDVVDDLGGVSLRVHGKGNKERTVPLPAGLAIELVEACTPGFAFPGDDSGHLSPRWVGKLITRLLPAELTMHTLRHRFASRAWSSGVDIWVLQSILGHASSDTTRRYVAIPKTAERAAIESMSRAA